MKKQRGNQVFWLIIAVGVLLLINFVWLLNRHAPMHLGVVSVFVLGISCVLYGSLRIVRKDRLIKNKWLAGILKTGILLLACSFLIMMALIWSAARDESDIRVDYVILLGAGLSGDRILESLQNRIDRGIAYLEENPDSKVIVSGGQGVGETVTEAQAMAEYLMAHGIPEDRILKEEKATSTYENLVFSREIMEKDSGDTQPQAIIATNNYHVFRTKILASRLGITAYALPSPTQWALLPANCIREYFAVLKSLALDGR